MVKDSFLWSGFFLESVPEEVIRSVTQSFEYREGAGFDETIKVECLRVTFVDQSIALVCTETGLLYEVPSWV